MRTMREAIRGNVSRKALVGATMAYNLEAKIFRVSTLCISLINTKVILVGLFIQYFRS